MTLKMPCDTQNERYCLAAILNTFEAADEAANALNEDDFYDNDHTKIFSLIKDLIKERIPVNHMTLAKRIDKPDGKFSWDYLVGLSHEYFSGMDYLSCFQKLRNMTALRRLILMLGNTMADAAHEGANYETLIGNFYTNLLRIENKSSGAIHPKQLLENFKRGMSYIEFIDWRRDRFAKGLPAFDGVSTGFPRLDATLGCFQNGAIYYIGARTSMGKTTFLLNLVANTIKTRKVAIFSLEMDAQMVFEKLMCIYADLKYAKFSGGNYTQEERERLTSLVPFFETCNLWFDDEQGLTISKLISRANRLVKVYGVEIIYIDYLTLIKSVGKHPNKHMQIDEISKGLQALAKQLNVPIVVLAQLNRAAGDGDRPSLTSFRESGSIEEDADACLLIHREEYYNPGTKPGMIDVIVAKNRIMGKLTTINFHCNSSQSERYYELEPIEDELKKLKDQQLKEEFDKQFPY